MKTKTKKRQKPSGRNVMGSPNGTRRPIAVNISPEAKAKFEEIYHAYRDSNNFSVGMTLEMIIEQAYDKGMNEQK